MPVICGLYEIGIINRFRDYDDLDTYATKSGVEGLLIGEDASDFMAFFGCEIRNPFEGSCFRMGMILDNNRGEPVLCSVHGNASIAIGMNSAVVVVDVASRRVVQSIRLDSIFHHLLCNQKVLVAVHELGARILKLPNLEEIADIFCEIVADAVLSDSELVLTSADEEVIRVDLVPRLVNP
jgi:hypothetical protein